MLPRRSIASTHPKYAFISFVLLPKHQSIYRSELSNRVKVVHIALALTVSGVTLPIVLLLFSPTATFIVTNITAALSGWYFRVEMNFNYPPTNCFTFFRLRSFALPMFTHNNGTGFGVPRSQGWRSFGDTMHWKYRSRPRPMRILSLLSRSFFVLRPDNFHFCTYVAFPQGPCTMPNRWKCVYCLT